MAKSPRADEKDRLGVLLKFHASRRTATGLTDCERPRFMTYVVTESCIKCKYTDCVDVCPVDCFREGPNILVIDPDECIDCDACVPECPVEAIFYEDNVPEEWTDFIQLNAEMATKCPSITERKRPLAD